MFPQSQHDVFTSFKESAPTGPGLPTGGAPTHRPTDLAFGAQVQALPSSG